MADQERYERGQAPAWLRATFIAALACFIVNLATLVVTLALMSSHSLQARALMARIAALEARPQQPAALPPPRQATQ